MTSIPTSGTTLVAEGAVALRMATNAPSFRAELEALINRHCMENGSNTPDFILAQFLVGSLAAFDSAVNRRSIWYAHPPHQIGIADPCAEQSPDKAATPPTELERD